jgi:hypothetical protein
VGFSTTAIVLGDAHLPVPAHAFGDGPPVSRTGGFGEQNCRECHWENPLNDGGARVELHGIPQILSPDSAYRLSVQLRHPAMKIAGFQISARFESGANRGKQAGSFRVLDDRAQVQRNDTIGVSYVGHTRKGTVLSAPGVALWTFEWTPPPAASDTIVFHVAANAADDTNSEGGDLIYVGVWRVPGG